MAIIVKEINLETSKPNLIQAIVAKQNDCNSRFLKVTFMDEGTVIPVHSSSKVTINANRNDGTSDSFYGEVNGDNTATVPLHSWMLELEGTVICDVSIIDVEGRKLTSTSFTVMVEKAAYGGDDVSSDPEYDVLVNLIAEVNETKENFTNALKGSVSGNAVRIEDSSPLEHPLSVKLDSDFGVELAEYPYCKEESGSTDLPKEGFYKVERTYMDDEDNVWIYFEGGYHWVDYTGFPELVLEFPNGSDAYFDGINLYAPSEYTKKGVPVSGAMVKGYGKNLYNLEASCDGVMLSKRSDGGFCCEKISGNYAKYVDISIPANTPFTFSFKGLEVNVENNTFLQFQIAYTTGNPGYPTLWQSSITEDGSYQYTCTYNREVKQLRFSFPTTVQEGEYFTFDSFQIEIGSNASDHVPYKEVSTYQADEDGKVVGVIAGGDPVTLVADTGITIMAEYNRDINKVVEDLVNAITSLGGNV